ncbi:hypothetical protein J8273_1323 [Carpediemonas membranifera]|uniref:Serpin domain-containing protein n=1 Tax=Carpediemonas membranifera TaxID=201153 RepID=A0A8J6B2F8_9EUKA|nr:hypothetical protein J8273_1323 [Carpediemonas membranifera]|eukprot:KAG9396975.1 hypothetical protein J8273_1323 [Carpediemonas membranifera]
MNGISGINHLQSQLNQYAFNPSSSSCTSGLSLLYTLLLLFTSVEETSPVYSNLCNVLDLNDVSLEAFKALLSNLDDAGVHTAASSFVRDFSGLNPVIESIQRTYLNSKCQPLTTAEAINQWASEHTNGTIREIIPELTGDIEAVLISALYFKAKWLHEFDPAGTRPQTFTTLSGEEKEVSTMHMRKTHRRVWDSAVSSGFVNEYIGSANGVEALFSLPTEPGEPGLRAALAELTTQTPEKDAKITGINISLPRFKIETTTLADPFLKQLGLTELYNSFQYAAVASNPYVSVSSTVQKTFLAVDEEGTEASAVTAMFIASGIFMDPKVDRDLEFDRPFVFALVDKASGSRLLTAVVIDPSS